LAGKDLDIDAWISGAKLPERAATVYARSDLVAEYEELDAELNRLQDQARRESAAGEATLGAGGGQAAMVRRMDEIRDEIDASARTFRFRAVTREQFEAVDAALKAEHGDDVPEAERTYATFAAGSIDGLTAEQWRKVRAVIGEGQFDLLLDTFKRASWERRTEVPFSYAASVARETPKS